MADPAIVICQLKMRGVMRYPYRPDEHWEIVDEPPERLVKNGRMPVPTRPGLGIELVTEKVRPFLWAIM
jgi:galactonate dehydratase